MPAISHTYGRDLVATASGDIATSDGAALARERILRRLLSNPGALTLSTDDLDYGAGVGLFVGQVADIAQVRALITEQMYLEASVSQVVSPQVSVGFDPGSGVISADVTFVFSETGQSVSLSFGS